MAIQFPPINAGDPAPVNDEIYLYLPTQETFKYDGINNAWTAQGVSNSAFGYYGKLNIQDPAPNAEVGWIYTVADGGTAAQVDPTFIGLAGVVDVPEGALVIYDGIKWDVITTSAGPWLRTAGGKIVPVNDGDDLDMLSGNYTIESLPDAP